MFSVTDINFANGVYGSNGNINGAEVFLLQSAENAENVINDFEKAFHNGLNPYTTFEEILASRRLSASDFTSSDMRKVERRVEEIYNAKKNEGRSWYA